MQIPNLLSELHSLPCRFEWAQLKALIAAKLVEVCTEYYEVTKDLEVAGESYDEVLKVRHACTWLLCPHSGVPALAALH